FAFETDDSIHHEKRKTVRQNLHYLVGIESAVARRWQSAGDSQRAPARLLAGDDAGQVRVDSMTRFYRYHMTPDAPPEQGEIADNIEYFVAHEFVLKTQWFLA